MSLALVRSSLLLSDEHQLKKISHRMTVPINLHNTVLFNRSSEKEQVLYLYLTFMEIMKIVDK